MYYNVSVFPESFKGKTKAYMQEQTKKISKLIPQHSRRLSIEDLAKAIDNMQVFCPATFIGDHKSQNELRSIQFFALDFDEGLDIETAKQRAEEYKLPITAVFNKYSNIYDDIERKMAQIDSAVRNNYHAYSCDEYCSYADKQRTLIPLYEY